MTIIELIVQTLLDAMKPVTVGSYSPRASQIAKKAKIAFRDENGGMYPIDSDHVTAVAKRLGISVSRDRDPRIGVSKVEFEQLKSVYSEKVICRCGFCPITVGMDNTKQVPTVIPNCTKCLNGFQPPYNSEVEAAKTALTTCKGQLASIPGGAIIIAARELGWSVDKSISGCFRVYPNKVAKSNIAAPKGKMKAKNRREPIPSTEVTPYPLNVKKAGG